MKLRSAAELNRVYDECLSFLTRKALSMAIVDGAVSAEVVIDVVRKINERFGLTREWVATFHPEFHVPQTFSIPLIGRDLTYWEALSLLAEVRTYDNVKAVLQWIPVVGRVTNASFDYTVIKKIGRMHALDCYHLCRHLVK